MLGLILGASTLGGVILLVVAGVMLVTAVAAFWPGYTAFAISTHPRGLVAWAMAYTATTLRRQAGSTYASTGSVTSLPIDRRSR